MKCNYKGFCCDKDGFDKCQAADDFPCIDQEKEGVKVKDKIRLKAIGIIAVIIGFAFAACILAEMYLR